MSGIRFENNMFIFNGQGDEIALLACDDVLSNKSRLPMYTLDGHQTVFELVVEMFDANSQFIKGNENSTLDFGVKLLDLIISNYLCKTALPVKVAELGAAEGIVSYHMAGLLGKFQPKSFFCCVSDSIGNESENQWLDRISLVEKAPRLSFLAADYDDTHLQEGNFDVVIINGMVNFMDPHKVICEAQRLVKGDGMIICFSIETPLLESCFKMVFPERKEYKITERSVLMTARAAGGAAGFGYEPLKNPREEIQTYVADIDRTIHNGEEIDAEAVLHRVREYLEMAAKWGDIKLKVQLIEFREALLNYVLFEKAAP